MSAGTPNGGFEYRDEIGGRHAGMSALAYLSACYTHSTREEWGRRLARGEILVDDTATASDVVLRAGQSVAWRRPPWVEPEAPLAFAILYEDDHLLALMKPPGLPTMPGGGFLEHTLLHQLRRRTPRAAIPHRLGRWTSGVVLAAKRPSAYAAVSAAFRERRIEKRYRTLAAGRPRQPAYAVDAPIGPVPYPILGTIHAASGDGKEARTRIAVRALRTDAFLADVWIETGRPHQIRIHLAVAGHPLVGDPLYAIGGRPAPGCRALPGDGGYLLHAAEIRLAHPATGAPLVVEAPAPAELRSASMGD